jgi:hypothetical protein
LADEACECFGFRKSFWPTVTWRPSTDADAPRPSCASAAGQLDALLRRMRLPYLMGHLPRYSAVEGGTTLSVDANADRNAGVL